MGLFGKKKIKCDICGNEKNKFSSFKVVGGNLCDTCFNKLSKEKFIKGYTLEQAKTELSKQEKLDNTVTKEESAGNSILGGIKKGINDVSRNTSLKAMIEKGEIIKLSEEDRIFFQTQNNKTPEDYFSEWEEKQRIKALKHAETQYNIGGLAFRRSENGYYYFGNTFIENADPLKLIDFIWDGPNYDIVSKTTGKNKTQGRAGSALVGAVLAGPTGAIIGGSRGKKTKVNTKTTSKQKERDTKAIIVFKSEDTGEIIKKEIKCSTRIANEIRKLPDIF